MTRSISQLSFVLYLVALVILGQHARAGLIPGDLDFTGSYFFDTLDADQTGDAVQSGTLFGRVSGVDTTVGYTGTSVSSGSNPVFETLLEHGDGVAQDGDGFGGTASVTVPSSAALSDFFADTDLGEDNQPIPLVITNNSLTQPYQIWMSLSYDHTVSAAGSNSFIISDLELKRDGGALIDRELISDTDPLFGNQKNGNPFPGAGGTVSDSGLFSFSFTLAPSTQTGITLDYTMFGRVLNAGDGPITGTASHFLSVDNVVAVPEPSSLLLFGMFLAGCLRRPASRFRGRV